MNAASIVEPRGAHCCPPLAVDHGPPPAAKKKAPAAIHQPGQSSYKLGAACGSLSLYTPLLAGINFRAKEMRSLSDG
jgi:hypothetical protein